MNIFEQAWEFFSGKKVAIGSLLFTVSVILRNYFPHLIIWAGVCDELGLLFVGGGFAHKAVKANRGE